MHHCQRQRSGKDEENGRKQDIEGFDRGARGGGLIWFWHCISFQ
jgi:hypothetical protein